MGSRCGAPKVLGALAKKDLSRRVEGYYKGDFLKLKEDTNSVAHDWAKLSVKLSKAPSRPTRPV